MKTLLQHAPFLVPTETARNALSFNNATHTRLVQSQIHFSVGITSMMQTSPAQFLVEVVLLVLVQAASHAMRTLNARSHPPMHLRRQGLLPDHQRAILL